MGALPEVQTLSHGGRGNTGGGNPGEKRAGSVQEVEKERGANVSPRWEAGKKGKKTQHCIIFCNKKGEEVGGKKMVGGGRIIRVLEKG